MNLLSVAKITEHSYDVVFDKHRELVIDQDSNLKLIANKTNGLYIVEESVNETAVAEETGTGKTTQPKADWHRRFDHLNARDLQEAIRKGRVQRIELRNSISNNYDICLKGKMARSPFPIKSEINRNLGPCAY